MPHITIEYSPNLTRCEPSAVLAQVNQALARSGVFDDADIKSRAVRLQDVLVGSQGAPCAFVHATIRLLAGRSAATRAALAADVLDALQRSLPDGAVDDRPVQVSVDVVEMDRATYAKTVVAR